MRDEARETYRLAKEAHGRLIDLTERLRVAQGRSVDVRELVDTVYALKKASENLEETRKEVDRLCGQLEAQTCALWVKLGDGDPIRTEYATGTPDVKQTVKQPKADTPEYEAFAAHFGVPKGAPFRPHWPSMLERITADQGAGLPLPPGCNPNEMWTVFRVSIRKRRPVLDEEMEDVAAASAAEEESPF